MYMYIFFLFSFTIIHFQLKEGRTNIIKPKIQLKLNSQEEKIEKHLHTEQKGTEDMVLMIEIKHIRVHIFYSSLTSLHTHTLHRSHRRAHISLFSKGFIFLILLFHLFFVLFHTTTIVPPPPPVRSNLILICCMMICMK